MKQSFILKPDACALLVIDMQRTFCEPEGSMYVPDSPRLIKKIRKLMDVFAERRRPVFFTRHIDSTGPESLMLRWWGGVIKEDDPMSRVTDALDTNLGKIIKKTQYDAFLYTPLEKELKARNTTQVVVCGVLTNCCCETTARSAFMRGFEVYFVTDGTATYGKKMHNASLLNLSYGFATLMDANSTIKRLRSTS
jgi:nicotinamidase-related amidase